MLDLENEQLQKTYRACRLGFVILSASLLVACFSSALPLFGHFHRELCLKILGSSFYQWLDMPIAWGCLFGTTLLWGRWEHAGWQRRVGLLLVMCLIDVGLSLLKHGPDLGMGTELIGHDWFRENLGEALGWSEFTLLATLSCDYLDHLGIEQARDSGTSTRAMAATGAVLWMVIFCLRTDWATPWPLQHRPGRPSIEEILLTQGSMLIWAITLMQVTALTISSARQSGYVLSELDREEEVNDPLRSRSMVADQHGPMASEVDPWK